MIRQTLFLLSLAGLLAGGVAAAQQGGAPKDQPDHIAHITLGQAAVPLYGPWKFTVGDSPIDPKTGEPLWAEPEFDDSKWEDVDLTPKDGAFDPIGGIPSYVPGWTAKGHPGYWGFAWYRIRVQVQGGQDGAVALAGPADVDDAYQVFDDGRLAGHFGDFTGTKPAVYASQPKLFALPGPGNHGANSTRVLAFRFWMDPGTPLSEPDAGGIHSAPVLGEAGAVAASYQIRWLELVRSYASLAAIGLLFGLLAVVAFTLILFDDSDRVYLWMGALFLIIALDALLGSIADWTQLFSYPITNLLTDCIGNSLIYAAWVMVWWVWFGLQRPSWLPRLVAGLTLLLIVSTVLGDEVFFGLVPHAFASHCVTMALVLRLLLFGLLLWVVVEGIRRRGLEGWLVLPLVVLRGVDVFRIQLGMLHVRMNWFPLGVHVNLGIAASLLVAVVIALLLLRRLLQSVRRQRLMALDVKQAQEVQQVILPEARLALPGLTIESEYRPAREVGGDFFQIIPHQSDGSVLIVAGDVVGKGLKAGMLVALLVGAVRTEEKHGNDPGSMLNTLNERLMGRGDAQATCLALRIEADGSATLANAGHMAPYLNGEVLAMEGALPLGMIEGAEVSVMHFSLKDGDRLMVMSDGVAEATDANGRLFGFERVNELMRTAGSAAEVAWAAQAFGQEDDISVISLMRTGGLEAAA